MDGVRGDMAKSALKISPRGGDRKPVGASAPRSAARSVDPSVIDETLEQRLDELRGRSMELLAGANRLLARLS